MKAAEKRAREALDSVIEDGPAWIALVSLLNSRGLRDGLVQLRRAHALTPAQVADRIGCAVRTVTSFEAARYPNPLLTFLQGYARAVDARLDFGLADLLEEPTDEPA